jgi:hypothetical protein
MRILAASPEFHALLRDLEQLPEPIQRETDRDAE